MIPHFTCNYYSELEESELLTAKKIQVYQMMISSAQWAITLDRYDIQYANNILARFGSGPRMGHLKGIIGGFGYQKHHRKHRLLLTTKNPNHSKLKFDKYDWTHYYKAAYNDLPLNMPTLVTKYTYISVYIDVSHSNLRPEVSHEY